MKSAGNEKLEKDNYRYYGKKLILTNEKAMREIIFLKLSLYEYI